MNPRKEKVSYDRITETSNIILDRAMNNDNLDIFDKSIVKGVFARAVDIEPDGKYYARIADEITRNNIDKDTLCSIGIDIGNDISVNSNHAKTMIVSYLNTLRGMNSLRLNLRGHTSDNTPIAALTHYLRMTLVNGMPRDDRTHRLFDLIQESLQKAHDMGDDVERNHYSTLIGYLETLHSNYDNRRNIVEIGSLYKNTTSLGTQEYTTLKTKSELLTNMAMRQRKYGTKPAYIDASIGGAWIFYDGNDWSQKMVRDTGRANQYDNVAAVVDYSDYREFKNIRFGVEQNDHGAVRRTGELADKVMFTLYIGKNGAISVDPDGLEGLEFSLNLSSEQEMSLRAEISSNFYDLSMPAMRHRPEDKVFEVPIDRKKANFDPIQDLLIPRIKYLEQPEDFPGSDDVTRTVREHDVTWFVRALPAGWHPSPEAVAEAEAHGIELAENETFVKAHTRGSQNKVLGYHAIRGSNQ